MTSLASPPARSGDRSPIWIGLADLLLCVVSVVIVAVAPTKAKVDGVKEKAEVLISIEWSVDIDADVDIWLLTPSRKPVFYGSRDVGCAKLDSDYRGFMDEHITLADGTETKVEAAKEIITLRCIEPGHYDLATHLYAYAGHPVTVDPNPDYQNLGLKVHVEIVKLNPTIKTVFAKDVTLDQVWQTLNVTGFDLDREGAITLSPPGLEPVTQGRYRQVGPGTGQGAARRSPAGPRW